MEALTDDDYVPSLDLQEQVQMMEAFFSSVLRDCILNKKRSASSPCVGEAERKKIRQCQTSQRLKRSRDECEPSRIVRQRGGICAPDLVRDLRSGCKDTSQLLFDLPGSSTLAEVNKAWKKASLFCHPDRGGSKKDQQCVNWHRDFRLGELGLEPKSLVGTRPGGCPPPIGAGKVNIEEEEEEEEEQEEEGAQEDPTEFPSLVSNVCAPQVITVCEEEDEEDGGYAPSPEETMEEEDDSMEGELWWQLHHDSLDDIEEEEECILEEEEEEDEYIEEVLEDEDEYIEEVLDEEEYFEEVLEDEGAQGLVLEENVLEGISEEEEQEEEEEEQEEEAAQEEEEATLTLLPTTGLCPPVPDPVFALLPSLVSPRDEGDCLDICKRFQSYMRDKGCDGVVQCHRRKRMKGPTEKPREKEGDNRGCPGGGKCYAKAVAYCN